MNPLIRQKIHDSNQIPQVVQDGLAPFAGAVIDDMEQVGTVAVVRTSPRQLDARTAVLIVDGQRFRAHLERPFDQLRRKTHEVSLDLTAALPKNLKSRLVCEPDAASLHYLEAGRVQPIQLLHGQSSEL